MNTSKVNTLRSHYHVSKITLKEKNMKAEVLNRVVKMHDFVKEMGDGLSLLRFHTILDNMIEIAHEIDDRGLLEDQQMYDVWELIMMFDDSVQNDMPIDYAREYLEKRLSSIIKTLQGEKVLIRE